LIKAQKHDNELKVGLV